MVFAGDINDPASEPLVGGEGAPANTEPQRPGGKPAGRGKRPQALLTGGHASPGPAYDLLLHRALAVAAQAEERLAQQNARIAELEKLVTTDELTGTCNRRGFYQHLQRAVATAARQGTQGVLVLIDLNGFKKVNDRLGHVAGDKLLERVGQELKRRTRDSDVVARLGGDEFAILMPACDPEQGKARAQAILDGVNASHCDYEGERIPINAAFGAAVFDGQREAESVLAAADGELYSDKKTAETRRR